MDLGAASAQRLLHGVIDAKILEAQLSVASDAQPKSQNLLRGMFLSLIKKLPLINYYSQGFGKTTYDLGQQQCASDRRLYATVGLDKVCVGRTRAIDAATTNDPRWKKEALHIYCAHSVTDVVITVVMTGAGDPATDATAVGHAYLPVEDIVGGMQVDRWLPVCDTRRRPLEGLDRVHVQVRFTDVSADPESRWGKGIGRPPVPFLGVPRTFFGQHRGCRVTLYQDAHAAAVSSSRCWEDIFDAIDKARRLVYIAGWSIDCDVTLVRDPRRPAQTLGQLLKKKAGQQVAVLVLVSTPGVVVPREGTAAAYFQGSGVHCVLCRRGNAAFTHQQKAVVVDSPRGLVGFVGGLDLCCGRYDTPEHPLFRTLGTVHRDDFHQPSFPGASPLKGGPREPWHDIHCRVEGPAARDVLDNFEQRWRKQGGGGGLLVDLPRRPAVPDEAAANQNAESWNAQVFRSIDSSAVAGFPEDDPDEAARRGLVTGEEGAAVERSIQDAYIHAIRRARFFIYIESQYFLGSSQSWLPQQDAARAAAAAAPEDNLAADATHLVAKELSLKIASKIRAGEWFRVYVVLPMWPEGEPESASTQAILDWQRRTMEMMYRDVALAMHARGIWGNPREYLSFFCLGNREAYSPGEYAAPERPELDSYYSRAQQARRFNINVHANTMIVDDEYIIVGSANINQRSMDGGRDSEMALGAYQPQHLASEYTQWRYSSHTGYYDYTYYPRGQVHQFRLSLWREHLGHAAAAGGELLNPESPSCMNRLNLAAQQHWDLYASDTFQGNLPGHLMAYPVGVSDRGELLETVVFFPDTKAWVFGSSSASANLPQILTI
ncbi:hypothetical protein BS78_K149800 [Paspalum vaginatum]|uniref:phospholipase D n=1 Tax=Paspalum vaginatum TaxID=158149 RepID=A0A9W7XBF5_9POAL|nr:hypothetical protein BS78_K149800 [Paspalum vaginatum]